MSYGGITAAELDQINVTIPQLAAADQSVVATVNGSSAQAGVMLSVGAQYSKEREA